MVAAVIRQIAARWTSAASDAPAASFAVMPRVTDPTGNPTYAWQSGEELLADRNRTIVVKRIARLAGLPAEDFLTLYHEVTAGFAAFVQLMPASEHHHHARLGGLLDHSLDVAERALSLRRGVLLPPGRPPEVVARAADKWTYAVFLAALLHDVGKPATDLDVHLYDHSGASCGVWIPSAGGMRPQCRYYVRYRADRVYERHQQIAPFIARSLIPVRSLAWIGDDPDLLASWLACLAGDYDAAGPIGDLVARADGESVAADLGAGEGARLLSSRKRPLNEMLMLALRHLLEEGRVKINRPGAEAWVTETDAWFVSRVVCEQIRSWLMEQGYSSVPGDNNRIFDELQQHRLCVPTEDDKAVWSMQIKAGDFDQKLTMLRFPIDKVWPDPERRPAPLDGELVPNAAPKIADREEAPAALVDPGLDASDLGPSKGDLAPDLTPIEPGVKPRESSKRSSTMKKVGDSREWEAIIDSFLEWLSAGLESGRLALNGGVDCTGVWTVEEGLFFETPGVLRDFAVEEGIGDYVALQKALARREALLLNMRPSPTPIIHYRHEDAESSWRGNVLVKPELLLKRKLPSACKAMTRARGKGGYY